ncbi:hypothetical protein BHQ29_09135 [Pseudomonas sp. LPH1]|nr:hypothetical protein BHQ29_09135 [Pseudomonas sp. LPH1]
MPQPQALISQITIDHATRRQFMFIGQVPEVEDGGLIWNALQAQVCELAQDGRLVQRFLHRWIAMTKPAPFG